VAYQTLIVEDHEAVRLIRLNRPEALNALNGALMDELTAVLDAGEADPAIRCFVITGSDRAFAAGADIKEMAPKSYADVFSEDFITRNWERVTRCRKPVIAAVAGYALGGGCELALMCDLIIAGDSARLGQPEINLGIIPGAGGTQRWPRTAGKYAAMEAMLSGSPVTARRGYELGLVNKVVPAEMTIQVAQRIARQLAEKAPLAARMAKEAVLKAFESPLAEGLAAERKSFYFLFSTEDQKEGMHAFLEKRRGVFKGK
jgi:enoyl-CoA hydratase/carnithine racemase